MDCACRRVCVCDGTVQSCSLMGVGVVGGLLEATKNKARRTENTTCKPSVTPSNPPHDKHSLWVSPQMIFWVLKELSAPHNAFRSSLECPSLFLRTGDFVDLPVVLSRVDPCCSSSLCATCIVTRLSGKPTTTLPQKPPHLSSRTHRTHNRR